MVNELMFREYDVRGLVGSELDAAFYERLGKAFGTIVREKTRVKNPRIAVGRDNRATSEEYQQAFERGLHAAGCDTTDLGMLTTPAAYYAGLHLAVEAVAAITASHNPPEYNGAKFRIGETPVSGLDVKKTFFEGNFATGSGKGSAQDVSGAYVKAIALECKASRPLKIVLDCGNGAAGSLATAALKACGHAVTPMYCEPDYTYPHHQPNPVKPENYPDLIAAVKRGKADLGIMLDGDGDRCCAVDEKGEIIWADSLLLLFARDYLKQQPGATVIVEIKCSQAILDDIPLKGGTADLCRTGYPNVEQMMREKGARLGGEMSGHFYFFNDAKRHDGSKWFSDAIYASCKLGQLVAGSGKTLSQMLEDAPKYYPSPEYRPQVTGEEKNKEKIVATIAAEFKREKGTSGVKDVIDIDGARVLFNDGWGLIRYSQNEPQLSLRFEGKTPEATARIREIFRKKLEGHPVDAKF